MPYKFVVLCFLAIAWGPAGPMLGPSRAEAPMDIPSNGWSYLFSDDDMVMASRTIPGHKFKAYRARGVLNAPIEQILEVLRDNGAATEWMPDLARQQVIKDISAVEMITLNTYAVPFPFADRELLLYNRLRLDPGLRVLMAEAVSINLPGVPVSEGKVRAHMFYGQTRLRPLDDQRTEVELVLLVEPRGRLPVFLAAFGLRRTPVKFLKALENRAQAAQYPVRLAYRKLLLELKGVSTASP